jgi:hypothetical protein
MQIDKAAVMKELKKHGFIEISHKTSFVGYRKTEQGGAYRVSIDILDAGEGAGNIRYHCVPTREDGKIAAGNEASSIEDAIRLVHWWELDE